MIGKTVAHYEIAELLGKGGMGEVYRARDGKLGRDVAIKILLNEVSGDPERVARFEREARTLASLQHPNVASIYGFETAENVRFLVMELVEGEDLSEHLARGAIPVGEAVELAAQLAQGLAAAHAIGVIHRDLKPANIKISSEGKLKILDFGLARAYTGDVGSDSVAQHSPTITAMTQAGVILGTAAYMAPEQARGKRADHRSDIWAFGVVLFEMLSGRRLFEGETVSDTLASVLRADVPWDRLPTDTPPALRRLLERCLDRDTSRRLQASAEARIALQDLSTGRSDASTPQAAAKRDARLGRERFVWISIIVALIAAVVALAFRRDAGPTQPLVQSTLSPPAGWDFAPASPFAVSPDGSQVAYVAFARPDNDETPAGTNSIWIRDLALPQPRQLATTDGDAYPFWSPDGRWLGFFANGKLNKIESRGGPVVPLCEATNGRGGTWNDTGTIVFQRAWSEGLMKVPAGGGKSEPATILDRDRHDIAHRWPHFLPDGRHFLFYLVSTTSPNTSEHSGVYVGSLDSTQSRLLLKSESRALYSEGHLLYRAGSTLMARPFDASRQVFTGDPTPLATDIPGSEISWGGAHFGVSESGVLVHMRGVGASNTLLYWRDRNGKVLSTVGDPANHVEPSVSHDGRRIALAVGQDVCDIWTYDLERGMRTRFTFDPADDRTPLWSPDDSQLVFASPPRIYVRPTSGQGDARLLFTADAQVGLTDWSLDGRLVFFDWTNPVDHDNDIWTLDMRTSEAMPLLSGAGEQMHATLSPDGRWLAFVSDESGRREVYVQPYPEAQGRWMVSSDAGTRSAERPRWRSDGRELFYLRGAAVVAVPVTADATFSFGTPKMLFSVNVTTSTADYQIGEGGQQILTNELPPADPSRVGATLIQNWTAALTP